MLGDTARAAPPSGAEAYVCGTRDGKTTCGLQALSGERQDHRVALSFLPAGKRSHSDPL